jgi:hypothetical protein
MALQKAIQTNFGVTFDQGYHLIGVLEHQITGQNATLGIVSYASAEHRADAKAKMQAYLAAFSDYAAKSDAWRNSEEGEPREAAYAAQLLAQHAVRAAEAALNTAQPLPLAVDKYTLAGSDYAAVIDEKGDLSRAKIYLWLKQQTKWVDSVDI